MSDAHEQFLDDVRAYTQAGDRLVAGVVEFNAMNTQAVGDIEQGMSLTESFELRDSSAWSRRISNLLEEFEACRRTTRASAAAALMAEGKNVSDVGRAFGVSHQLASRFSRVARDGTETDEPTEE
jgi:hypothetical protein